VALKNRRKIQHSEPLEGDDARRFVEDVENPQPSPERSDFLKKSKGIFEKLYSPKSANSFFRH
jgi:hypothetical protein